MSLAMHVDLSVLTCVGIRVDVCAYGYCPHGTVHSGLVPVNTDVCLTTPAPLPGLSHPPGMV